MADDEVCLGDTIHLTGAATAIPWGTPPPPTGLGAAIPNGQGVPYTSVISVDTADPGQTLSSLDGLLAVCVSMEHSYMGDLVIGVTCPNGQNVYFHQQGGAGTFIGDALDGETDPPTFGVCWDYCWDPTATNGTWSENAGTSPLPAGSYESVQPMSQLVGCPLNGFWTLSIMDLFGIDDGFLCEWSISFAESVLPEQGGFLPVLQSFEWTGPGIIANGSDSTMATAIADEVGDLQYTFTVTDDFGCAYDTALTISVAPLPVVTLTTPDAIDVDGGPFTFNEGTPAGGWYVIDGVETATVDPIIYAVGHSIVVIYFYTDPQTGCTGSATANVLVEQITALDLVDAGASLRVAPNPATDQCQLSFNATGDAQIPLVRCTWPNYTHMEGAAIFAVLDLNGLAAGNYQFTVGTSIGVENCRLTIE
ncbi:MAG: proprotein convertase P-domain-containing protein [Flavobacteriales bacterium]|nr:proprotein convertase P-domain-containing protein [Flavobacteriales bacterium]